MIFPPRPIIFSFLRIGLRPGLVQADNISVQGRLYFRPRPMTFPVWELNSVPVSSRPIIFPSKADYIFLLRIEFRPALVQGRDGIQFLADNIWTMDDDIGRDDVLPLHPARSADFTSPTHTRFPTSLHGSAQVLFSWIQNPLTSYFLQIT